VTRWSRSVIAAEIEPKFHDPSRYSMLYYWWRLFHCCSGSRHRSIKRRTEDNYVHQRLPTCFLLHDKDLGVSPLVPTARSTMHVIHRHKAYVIRIDGSLTAMRVASPANSS
jgi:hypothetical protein